MPIAYQDLYLLLRAENLGTSAITSFGGAVEALGAKGKMTSRQLSAIGTGLVTGGTVLAATGAIGLKFWYDAGKAAVNYQAQSAYALTQAKGYGISLKDVEKIGLNVAKTVPVAFDSIQLGLYHIFSTIKTNKKEYQTLVTDFAKAAVAGNSDIATTSKTTIAEIQAWHLPLKDTNMLLDQEFQMVKLGRGQYSQFIDVLGSAIPVYRGNNQSIKEMLANFAFMSRTGAPAGSAVASISRAVEAVNKSGFQAGLKALGISLLDAHGKAKPLDEIIKEIAGDDKWKAIVKSSGSVGLAFTNTFGSGTIQARRFFDLALTRYPMLKQVIDGMNHSKGAMERAYEIQSHTTAAQIQLLKNNFKALEITLGNDVLPIFNKFLGYLERVIHWFDGLSPGVKKLIAFGSLFGSIGAVIGGVIMILTGFFLKFLAVIMDVTGAEGLGELFTMMKGAAAASAPWIAVIVAIGVALYLVIKYHKEIWEWMQRVWHDALTWIARVRTELEHLWKTSLVFKIAIAALLTPFLSLIAVIVLIIKYHKDLEQWGKDAWKAIKTAAVDAFNSIRDVVDDVAKFFQTTWDAVFDWFSTNWDEMRQVVQIAWYLISNYVKIYFNIIMDILRPGMEIIKTIFSFGWRVIATVTKAVWDIISGLVRDGMKLIMTIIDGAWGVIDDLWHVIWDTLSFVVKTDWDIITGLIKTAWSIIEGIFTVALDLVTGHWSKAWNDMKHYASQAWHDITNMLSSVLSNIIKLIVQVVPRIWNAMLTIGKTIINALWQGVDDTWHLIYNFFHGIVKVIVAFFAGLWDAMYGIGKAIVEGLWKGIKDTWHLVKDGLDHLGHGILDGFKHLFGIFSPSTVYYDFGKNMMQGLANGISGNAHLVKQAHDALTKSLPVGFNKLNTSGITSALSNGGSNHIQLINIVMPKGMVTIQVSSALSTAEQQKLEQGTEAILDKFSDQMVSKFKKVKVS